MTEIENDLRTWMQARAARVHASSEILETAYRPRARRSWHPSLAIGGSVVALAGTITAVLPLAGGASAAGPGLQNASGWTSYPPVTPADGRLFLWTDHTATASGQRYGTMIAPRPAPT